ncbi:TonB-dependent receptor [Sphingomonas psychrolutea]|uniref:TonB-dependent receptor n=1 Tax=Sphingomonas psychrolutea TaxID=1259676 RepID=A0ABQ1H316_9SPHN|nr:TonB-dependent receptor [Sphingomonas psychrolutea]GGA56045.1 TonB-dependent receptor [Sphingomonas psychrolutea]
MTTSHHQTENFGRRTSLLALLLASGASLALVAPSAAFAAPDPAAAAAAQAAPAAPAKDELTDIVVTASRSGAESLQKVPIAVSVVNIDQITKSGQGNLSDLAKFTPSLSITEGAPGFNKFNMRGLSTGGYATSDTSDRSLVAVYLDDTPISVQGQTPDLKVYDLERVEILRGPQGTLFGAGSMAGTIRFVTAKPSLTKTFGTAEAGVATTEHGAASYNIRGMINLPIVSDTLAVRANFYVGRDGGFIDNIGLRNKQNANSNNTYQGRVAVRWTPSPDLTVDGSITYERSIARGLNSAFSGLAPYTVLTNGPEGTDDRFRLYQLGADYDAGFANLIVTGAYTDRAIGFDASVEPQIGYFFQDYGSALTPQTNTYPLFEAPTAYSDNLARSLPAELYQIDQKLKDYMGEARLVSKSGGPLKWTVGVFYEQQDRHLRQDIPTAGFDTLSYVNYFYGPFAVPGGKYNSQTVDGAFQPNDIFSGLQDVNEHQFAAYADGTWHVTDRLDLTAGVRYFNFKEKYYLFESGFYGVVNHVPLTTNATLKSNGFNPRGNISYKVNDDFLVYGEVAKGFRYGGGNQPVPIGTAGIAGQCASNLASYGYTAAPLTFGPDKLWNYTIGEKAKLAGGRITLNASAYYIDWSDVQTRLRLNCSYFFTDNKGKITSKGLELETMIKATPELTLSLSGSINDSKANGDIPTVGAFDGDRTPYYPKYTANFQAFYDRPVGHGDLHLQLGYQYQSSQNTTFNNFSTTLTGGKLTATGPSQTFAVIPESHNLSASATYNIGQFEFGVYGNNLADGVTVTNIARATYYQVYQAGSRNTLARPRTIGLRAKVKF